MTRTSDYRKCFHLKSFTPLQIEHSHRICVIFNVESFLARCVDFQELHAHCAMHCSFSYCILGSAFLYIAICPKTAHLWTGTVIAYQRIGLNVMCLTWSLFTEVTNIASCPHTVTILDRLLQTWFEYTPLLQKCDICNICIYILLYKCDGVWHRCCSQSCRLCLSELLSNVVRHI